MVRTINATSEYFEKTVQINFNSNSTFLGHDILLWEPDNLVRFYQGAIAADPIKGVPITQETFEVIVQDIRRRNEEIKQLLALGKSIFIFLPPPQMVYTSKIGSINLLDYIDFVQLQTTRIEGETISFRGDEPFTSFWENTKGHYVFKAQLDTSLGKPLYFIDGTQVIIGSHIQVANGHIVFMPTLKIKLDTTLDEINNIKISFIEAIVNLTEALATFKGSEIFIMPPWSVNYILPGERDLKTDLLNLEEELKTLRQKINHKSGLLEELDQNKLLFAGHGDSLEVEVRRVFEELGFTVMEVLPDRDDLILQYDNRIAVVEIKGVLRKSAAERHAAQLEKWVSSYFSDKGNRPKGILVANPYCEVPLIDRKEEAFPPQMRPYSEAREHCLITGLQLLSLYLDCREDEEKKARMIHLLFNTKGVFSEYQDWTQFIELAKTVETTYSNH